MDDDSRGCLCLLLLPLVVLGGLLIISGIGTKDIVFGGIGMALVVAGLAMPVSMILREGVGDLLHQRAHEKRMQEREDQEQREQRERNARIDREERERRAREEHEYKAKLAKLRERQKLPPKKR